ncbi:MAG: gas vesicle protein K [Acidobacteriota bacterium]
MSTREVVRLEVEELEALRQEIEKRVSAEAGEAPRWNADPEEVERSVARLVLTLVDFVRRLLERQAIRRMEAETLTPEEVEALGIALMKLEETIRDIAGKFGLDPDELNLDLGPLGRLI